MAKDPAFLFYPGDWSLGTMGFTIEDKGAYMELLVMQFSFGKFTEAQAQQVLGISFSKCFAKIKHKFSTDGEFYWNERLREEIEKRKKFSNSRRNNALGRNKNKKETSASAEHMEDVNENENESKNPQPLTIGGENLKKKIIEFYQYRSEKKNPILPSQQGRFLNKLSDLSKNNDQDAIKILENSMANGWTGIFDLKQNQSTSTGAPTITVAPPSFKPPKTA